MKRAQRELKVLPHPKDRKIDQLQRQLRRDVRSDIRRETSKNEEALLVTRFFWFREQLTTLAAEAAVPRDEVEALARLYVGRNDDEMKELRAARNPPRGRIAQLEALRQRELDLLGSTRRGLVVPDITTGDGVEILLRVWDGAAATLRVVPTLALTADADRAAEVAAAQAVLRERLRPTDAVRAAQAEVSMPARARAFAAERPKAPAAGAAAAAAAAGRKKSAKATHSAEDVAAGGRRRRLHQQQQSTKHRRHAAIAQSRGLM